MAASASLVTLDQDSDSDCKRLNVSSSLIVPPARKRRDRKLRRSDWEMMRRRITSLYSRLTLPEVMKIMYERHGFQAKHYMYKARFQKWGINVKKEHGDRFNESSLNCDPQQRPSHGLHPSVGGTLPKLIHTPCNHPSETFLRCAREYTRIRLPAYSGPATSSPGESDTVAVARLSRMESQLVSRLSKAHLALRIGDASHACKWVDKVCDTAAAALDEASLSLISIFADLQSIWDRKPDLGRIFTKFFLQMAEEKFAKTPDPHQAYIIQLFRLFLDNHHSSIIEAVGTVVLNTAREVNPVNVIANFHVASMVGAMYHISGLSECSLKLAKQNEQFCQQQFGSSHVLTEVARTELAWSYFYRGDVVEALEVAATFIHSKAGTVLSLYAILAASLIAGHSSLILGKPREAMYFSRLPAYYLRGVIVDDSDEYLLYRIECSEHVAYDIWRSQISPSDLQHLENHYRSLYCPSCQDADDWFKRVSRAHWWPDFEHDTPGIEQFGLAEPRNCRIELPTNVD